MKASRLAPACSPVIEQLESRQMLAVTLADGVLTVSATSRADTIKLAAGTGANAQVTVRINNGRTQSFRRADLDFVDVIGRGGNDKITVKGVVPGLTIRAGGGDDLVKSGGGSDLVLGGTGDDDLFGRNGDDQIYGDAGDDSVIGGNGNDTLGGDDEDTLVARGDTAPADVGDEDTLNGGLGNDWLLSGTESDLHDDLSGNDQLTGGPGRDIIDIRGRQPSGQEFEVGEGDTITDLDEDGDGDIVPIKDVTGPFSGNENDYSQHKHAFIKIFINGDEIRIPDNVGQFLGEPVVHTHDEPSPPDVRGMQLHFHNTPTSGGTARVFTLEDFFRNWGISFSSQNIGRFRVDADHELVMEVKPKGAGSFVPNSEFEDYAIKTDNHELDSTKFDQIIIRYRERT